MAAALCRCFYGSRFVSVCLFVCLDGRTMLLSADYVNEHIFLNVKVCVYEREL